ncbi:NAD(P)-dependent oxidoreductase [Pedobacter sp. L105]|uniref:NAD(P)-dependent oxidoreductase n=1 Tax=Pedobacter sp. L105 TaxID=1641871 RepID=UPI00131B68B1|nr:NAD(P)-dependent oxidoreductase [Pedobacter sp. L105]
MKNIGWIGLGNMGTPMIKNLVKAGFAVTVYNRSADKTKALAAEINIGIAGSPAELVEKSDVIITMLTDDAAVKSVYEGADGIFSAASRKDLIAVDMSTVAPETTQTLAALCREKGISYLDAPVAGSVKPAEDAQLVIMVGGEEAVYEKVKPVFDALGKASIYLGENGKANVAKLSVNLFLGIVVQGLSEAVIFARKNGLAAEALLPIINAAAVGSGLTKMKTENIIHNDFKPAFALKLLAKDIRLAKASGMDTPVGESLSATLQGALEKHGEEDMIAVLKYLSEK